MMINTFKAILKKEGNLCISKSNSIYHITYSRRGSMLFDFYAMDLELILEDLVSIIKGAEYLQKIMQRAA